MIVQSTIWHAVDFRNDSLLLFVKSDKSDKDMQQQVHV